MFGVRLEESLQYASVAISMVAPDGKQYVYGYVPIVVAKCGMMLKETGTSNLVLFAPARRVADQADVSDCSDPDGRDLSRVRFQ